MYEYPGELQKRCDKGNLVLTGNKTYSKIMVEKTNSVKLIQE